MRRPSVSLVSLLLLLLIAATACRVPLPAHKLQPSRGGSFTEALVGSAGTLNPLFAQEDNARDIDSVIYQGLTRIGGDQQPQPALASGWTLSPDHRSYTFTLRDGVKWADGRPFTVDDVLFTFAVLQDPSYDQPDAALWRNVSVSKWGPTQVKFTLKAPSASFLATLSIGIIAKHLFSSATPDEVAANNHSTITALGTGPYMVQSISPDHQTVALRRNQYASPAPHLDSLVFRSFPTLDDATNAFQSGLVDAVGGVQPPALASLQRRPDMRLVSSRTFSFVGVLLNVSPDVGNVFSSDLVRTAMVESINRQRIVTDVLHGQADVDGGPIPPSDWAFSASAQKYHFDPQDARSRLDEAGWIEPAGGGTRIRYGLAFKVKLIAVDTYPYNAVAAAVSSQLKEVGIDATVVTIPAAVLVENYLMGRHYQMMLVAYDNGSDPDQYTLWHSDPNNPTLSFTKLPAQALLDKDLEDGRTAATHAERLAIYADFQSLLSQAAPAIFLYEPHYLYAVSNRIQGVHMNATIEPADRFEYITDWFVPPQRV